MQTILTKVDSLTSTALHLDNDHTLVRSPLVSYTLDVILIHRVVTVGVEAALPVSHDLKPHLSSTPLSRVMMPGLLFAVSIPIAFSVIFGGAPLHLTWSLE